MGGPCGCEIKVASHVGFHVRERSCGSILGLCPWNVEYLESSVVMELMVDNVGEAIWVGEECSLAELPEPGLSDAVQ